MTPEQLSETIVDALAALVADGAITLPDGVPTQVTVERPRQKGHGDYATNVALQLAKKAGTNPRAFAELVAAQLRASDGVARGRDRRSGLPQHHRRGRCPGPGRGRHRRGRGRRTAPPTRSRARRSTSSSSPPTPPARCTSAAVRWAAVGDALGRIFDHDRRRRHARVLLQRPRRPDRPLQLLAAGLGEGPARCPRTATAATTSRRSPRTSSPQRPDVLDLPDDEAQEVFRDVGVELMFEEIKQSLHDFGVDFDVYFHENNLHESGAVERAIERLTEMGNTYEADGALWLRTEKYGDDKDRVIVRSNGTAAYLSGDLAYYLDKRERGFDRCFIMLGADHHGYVGRMNAMCAAFGDEPGKNLEILIGQMVNLLRDGEPMRMSKRDGTIVSIDDLVDAIGVDASRYALARYTQRHHRSTSTSTCGPRRPTTTRSTTCSTPTPARAEPDAQRRRPRDADRPSRRPDAARPTRRTASCCGRWPSSRGSSRPRPSCASRTASRATSRTLRRYSTTGTTQGLPDAAARRRAGSADLHARPAWCSSTRPGSCSPTACACSASPLPSGCDRACPPRTRPAGRTPTAPCGAAPLAA